MDFLPTENATLLEGQLTQVDESAADKFIMKEAQWFTVNYSNAANKIYDVFNKYDDYLKKSAGLKQSTLSRFTLEKMNERFEEILNSYVKEQPKVVQFQVPKLNKNIQIPKLNKV